LGGIFSEKTQGDISIILKAILISALVFSGFHFYQIYRHLPDMNSIFELRSMFDTPVRTGSVLVVLAIAVLLYSELYRFIAWRTGVKAIILAICVTSLVVSMSRSWLMSFVVLTVIFSLLKIRKRTSFLVFTSLLLVIAVIFFLIFPMSDQVICRGGFFCKMLESVQELTPKYYIFAPDVSTYWRGYETYMAFQQYKDGNAFQLFFGQGLGVLIDLNISIAFGAEEFDRIPIMHNGYMYLLVKFGIAGLFIYVAQCIRFLVLGMNAFADDEYEQRLMGAFIVSMSVMIMLLTFANAGFFNKNSMIPVLFFLAAFSRSRFYAIDKSMRK
jgi:O-antigen ligase